MMEEKENRSWHLIRNDNGEWISDDNVVLLTPQEERHLKIMAKLQGKPLSIQHGTDGPWQLLLRDGSSFRKDHLVYWRCDPLCPHHYFYDQAHIWQSIVTQKFYQHDAQLVRNLQRLDGRMRHRRQDECRPDP